MTITLKIILIVTLLSILYQDIKEREVYWFLFPLVGISAGLLFYFNTLPELFLLTVSINLILVALMLVVLYAYIKLRLKLSFKETLGFGDILLFVMLALAFSNISFYVLFISALVFSLVLHLILNRNKKERDVPLAGYMSGFFMLVFLGFWSGLIDNLYSL
jgi:hypothetical protein